jgi:hypothetical protein
MSAYLHIIFNYDFFLACFSYELVTKSFFISGYVLKNMSRVGCGQVSQNLPYFDLSVAYVRFKAIPELATIEAVNS